jgi:DNA-binding GntR family transcriptional regulator
MREYRSLRELVESSLRQDIIAGVFPPGTHLLERELSERYEVSRGPIREALQGLEAQRLITHSRNRGVRVAQLSVEEMSEIYEMRVALEGLAAKIAVQAADGAGLEYVRTYFDVLSSAPTGDPRWLTKNNDFHCAIYELGQRPRLLDLIRVLMERVAPYIQLYLEEQEHLVHSADEHNELWRAFQQKDARRVVELTEQHLSHAGEVMQTMLDRLATTTDLVGAE